MERETQKSVLRRKLSQAAGTSAVEDRKVLRALRQAAPRVADEACGLQAAVIGARQSRVALDDLLSILPADRLLVILDGPGGLTGAATLSSESVLALVQAQTVGAVLNLDMDGRTFTATDAALIAPFVDMLLAQMAADCDVAAGEGAFRFGAHCPDAHAVSIAIQSDLCQVFELTLDLAGGVGQGQIALILPEAEDGGHPSEVAPAEPAVDDALSVIPVELTGVFGRLRLPVSRLSGLQPGDVVALEHDGFARAELWDTGGRRVSYGRLGQAAGYRALRLNESGVPAGEDATGPSEQFIAAQDPARQGRNEQDVLPPTGRTAGPGDGDRQVSTKGPADEPVDEAVEVELGELSTEEAAQEISQLAGLSGDKGDGLEAGGHTPA